MEVGRMEGVVTVKADMCQFGLMTRGKAGEGYARKPTRFMTNSPLVAVELSRRCPGNHEHIPLMEGRAAAAAACTDSLCRAMCRGVVRQKVCDQTHTRPVGKLNTMAKVNPGDIAVDGRFDGHHENDGTDAAVCPTLNGLQT